MKILMLLDHKFPPDIRIENEIQSLYKVGHKVYLACFGEEDTEITVNCTIFRRPISKFIHKSSVGILKFPFYFNYWRKFLKSIPECYKFDAIQVNDLPLAKIGYEFAQKHNAKFVLDLHENWPAFIKFATHTQSLLGKVLSSYKQWVRYEKKYCKLADNIIVVVDEAKERLVKLGIKADKITVVSNVLNLNNFAPVNLKPDPKYITLLYVGGVIKYRGLQHVIRSLPLLDENVRLWILGDGSYVRTLKQLALDLKVYDRVSFKGHLSYKAMQVYFAISDYCLIPHEKNDHTDATIPHKIFQYMYAGKPMLVSNCRPLWRIAEETRSGTIYLYNSPRSFVCAFRNLMRNKWFKSKRFVVNNRKFIKDKYNWELESKKLTKIYGS